MQSFESQFRLVSGNFIIQFDSPRRVLSSATVGGGFCQARYILNHYVHKDSLNQNRLRSSQFREEPEIYLKAIAKELGLEGEGVGLMTAVNIPKKLVVHRCAFNDLWIEGFFTVGIGNSVRAGDPAGTVKENLREHSLGTINMILISNAELRDSAMVEALQVAAEAKAAVLLEWGVKSTVSSSPATGTGTDCTAIVSGEGPSIQYSGTHTKMGELVGSLVMDGIRDGLKKCVKV